MSQQPTVPNFVPTPDQPNIINGDLLVTGDEIIDGNLTVKGHITGGGGGGGAGSFTSLTVTGASSLNTLTTSGNETVGGNLTVTGNATIDGTLAVDHGFSALSSNIDGNEIVGGSVTAGSYSTTGALTVGGLTTLGNLDVNGSTVNITNQLSVGSISTTGEIFSTNNVVIGGTLGVTGASTLGTLTASTIGATSLTATGGVIAATVMPNSIVVGLNNPGNPTTMASTGINSANMSVSSNTITITGATSTSMYLVYLTYTGFPIVALSTVDMIVAMTNGASSQGTAGAFGISSSTADNYTISGSFLMAAVSPGTITFVVNASNIQDGGGVLTVTQLTV